ncbi:MAG TPA: site-specific integrase [Syntrophorhabdaceae bacterium]|nr:site-specific integrase [Syntrophorhabdaceae bacterium]
MNTKEAISLFGFYQQSNHRKRTAESYRSLLQHLNAFFADRHLDSIKPDEIYHFLEHVTKGLAKSTRRLRYAQLKAFFNFIIEKCNPDLKNPCSVSLLSKTFRMPRQTPRTILEKELVDEMIYNTKNQRNRLMLELLARCGLRIGELLNIRASDVSERRLAIKGPKSGNEAEVAFMPEHVARRLNEYITRKSLSPDTRVFPICYSTARTFIKKLGAKLNVAISPHDLRRYSATYASRNGVPLEIVSKIILRHQDLKTTQVYLGKVSDQEAIRWMDILHGK